MTVQQLIISFAKVKVCRGKKCVLDIDGLTIDQGQLVAVMGPNGSGKSTLLQAVNGLLPVQTGSITVLGEELPSNNLLRLRRRSAMVFQDPLFIHDTVYENVALPLRFRGLSGGEATARVEAVLTLFRCRHLRDRLAHRLSGGEAQRVCLARAFVAEPELLLLDEPFSALDPATRNDLLAELKAAALRRGVTVLLVSHNLDEALRFAQRTVVMDGGKVVQDAAPEAVLRRPVTLTIARLAGMDNIWPCQLRQAGGQSEVQISGGPSFTANQHGRAGSAWCCLPGDSFRIISDDRGAESSWIRLNAEIYQVVPGIGVTHVEAQAGDLKLTLRLPATEMGGLAAGQKIIAAFQERAAHIVTA